MNINRLFIKAEDSSQTPPLAQTPMPCQLLMETYVLDSNRCSDPPIWRRQKRPSIMSQALSKSRAERHLSAAAAKKQISAEKRRSTNEPAFP